MANYLTTGQMAKRLRVSISTLKRWIATEAALPGKMRNASGWRLFSEKDLLILKQFKQEKRKNGRKFTSTTLTPVLKS